MTARVVSSERGATPPRRKPGARSASARSSSAPRAAASTRTATAARPTNAKPAPKGTAKGAANGAASTPKRQPKAAGRATRKAQRQSGAARPRRRRSALWVALGSVVLVGLLFAFVYPTRTFLDQRADLGRARDQLSVLSRENAKLAAEAKRLQQPDEIERRARDYGLVLPGEQGYVIVPAPTVPPAIAPAGGTTTPSP